MGDTAPMEFYRQSTVYSPRSRGYQRRSPCLPTPETSRSSNGSLDELVPRTYARDGMRIYSLLSDDQPDRRNDCSDRNYNNASARPDSRQRSAPRSPPYQGVDSQKPSLPPLKTVLGGTITSPPDTPPTRQGLFQPGPREPALSASTYKPPALYPNKKPRTEGVLDPSPTFDPRSSLSSQGLPTSSLEPDYGSSAHGPVASHGHARPRLEYEGGRRHSVYQAPTLRHEQSSPDAVNYQYSRGFADEARPRVGVSTAGGAYRSPEPAPFPTSRSEPRYAHPSSSTAQARSQTDYFGPSADRYALPSDRGMSRRSSDVSQRDFVPPHAIDLSRGVYPTSRSTHYSLPMRDDSSLSKEQPQYIDRDRLQPQDVYNGMPAYHDPQPTFFMPSHNDYQQGKTRKRSNLPKQSTEIMKTWFDQNITNPYPSEEQKAVFSNATGISMTQVSNWFINHRRRCPELRDKRDRTRIGGPDGEHNV